MEELGRPARLGNLVVATDFSQSDALDRALLLPMTPGSSITLLHVVPVGLPERLERSFHATAARLLGELAATATSSLRAAGECDVDVFTAVETGKAVPVICEQAQSVRAQLIVVGRTGAGRTAAHPIGATAERVARASATSVLVVAGRPRGPYRNPLVAIDGSQLAPAVVELALRVVEPGLKTALLAHAFDVPDLGVLNYAETSDAERRAYIEQFARQARRDIEALLPLLPSLGVAYEPLVLEGDARRVLLEEAGRRRSDLIAVGTRGHNRLFRLLMGSVAEAIVRKATIDVLVTR